MMRCVGMGSQEKQELSLQHGHKGHARTRVTKDVTDKADIACAPCVT